MYLVEAFALLLPPPIRVSLCYFFLVEIGDKKKNKKTELKKKKERKL